MRRLIAAFAVAGAGLWLSMATPAAEQASTLDTAKAKAWVGEWVLTMEGRRGPQERPLTITDMGGKIAA